MSALKPLNSNDLKDPNLTRLNGNFDAVVGLTGTGPASANSAISAITYLSVTLQAGWTSAGGFTPSAAINAQGQLCLAGGYTTASYVNAGVAAQLPTGMSPASGLRGPVVIFDNTSGTYNVGEWVISTSGALSFDSSVTAGHQVFVWMDGLTCRLK
jgi:hypothetical protein